METSIIGEEGIWLVATTFYLTRVLRLTGGKRGQPYIYKPLSDMILAPLIWFYFKG